MRAGSVPRVVRPPPGVVSVPMLSFRGLLLRLVLSFVLVRPPPPSMVLPDPTSHRAHPPPLELLPVTMLTFLLLLLLLVASLPPCRPPVLFLGLLPPLRQHGPPPPREV